MIKVKDLEFSYGHKGKKAVKGIDFDISRGEIFGFLGPSGAGKTTTQRILIGLLRGYTGSVEIMGRERRNWSKDFFEKIGVAFDFPNLYEKLTAYENLKLIASYYNKQASSIDSLLEEVGLLPDSNKKVEGFSKGMKMRLNFIRSLMHDPDIYFFDEPTSGLDPVNAKIIKDMILRLKSRGKTVFMTTHNMTVAEQLCDRVAFIVDGTIPVIDRPSELKVRHGKHSVRIEYYYEGVLKADEFPLETMGSNEGLFNIMKNFKVKTIHTQEATLEDIFIKLTGRELL